MENNISTPSTPPKQVTIKAEIVTAKYHPVEQALLIVVRLPNGKLWSHPDLPTNYLFDGKPADKTENEEVNREMERLAALYRQSKGRPINIQVDESILK